MLILGLFLGCSKKNNSNGSSDSEDVNKSQNLLAVGDSARDLLANDNFSNLLIEVAYVQGFRPTDETMITFENYLRERTFKENIEMRYVALPSPNQEDLTIQEVANLEEENRTAFNDGDTLAIYIYFADAPDADDDPDSGIVTLGSVYRNTSMVIYGSTVRTLAASSLLVSLADVESTTINHEFGHLFGLINLGTPTVNDHEDIQLDDNGDPVLDASGNPVGNRHCSVEACLMRAELEFGMGIMGMLESMASKGLAIPVLDPECILDLQANGGR